MARADEEAPELQQAVLHDVISGDVEAFLKTLAAHGKTRDAALRYLMDWFHQWQQEYEAYVQVLETEEAKADADADADADTSKEKEAEPAALDETDLDGKLETLAKDLEELEAEAQDVLGGVRMLAIDLLETAAEGEDAEPPEKIVDRFGWTLLMQAANSGLRDLLQVLLEEHHADVNAAGTTTNGLSPLYLAVSSDHMEEALLLLQHGAIASATRVVGTSTDDKDAKPKEPAETKAKTDAETPAETEEDCAWFEACRQGQVTVVNEMIAKGVDLNFALPSTGDTALHVSVMFDMQDIVELLVAQKDVKVNTLNHSGQTCLFGCSDVELAQFLVDHGVDPRVVDSDGETAYSVAKELEDDDVCGFLEPLTKE